MFGYFTRQLGRTLRRPRSGRRPARHAPAYAVQLWVASLEDRVTPATLHWLGSGAANGNLWSVAANWLENRAPASGDRVVFDTSAPGFPAASNSFAPSNDLSGLTNLTVGINDASSAGDFSISGNAFGLNAAAGTGISSTLAVGTAATINNNITLAADTTVAVGLGALTLGGAIGGSGSLTAAGAPASTLTLSGANTYTGGTALNSGTVAVGTNTALGAATGVLTLNGGTLANSAAFLTLANPFVVSAPSTIGGGSFLALSGDGVLNATLALANSGSLTLNGALSGPGGLNEIGFPGGTTLGGSAANTFTGGATVTSGGLTLAKTAGVTALASPATVLKGFASLTLGASDQIADGVGVSLGQGATFNTAGYSDTVASLTGLGSLATGSNAAAGLTVAGAGNQLLTGAVSGAGLLTFRGSGTLTLAGASSGYTGTLTAAAGTLVVASDFSGAAAAVTGGTLGGTGAVKSIAATGGTVTAAAVGTGGTLTAAGAASSLSSGTTLRVDLVAQGAGDHLVLGANATLNLNNAVLSLNAAGPAFESVYQLVTSPTAGITGTFSGLPDNATVSAGGQSFRINYTSTAVTLTNLGTGGTVLHWTGATSSNWSVAGNWAEGVVPASGDTLIFDTSAPGFAATAAAFAPSNDLTGLTNLALVINDSSTAGDFAIGGNAVTLVTTAGTGVASTVTAGAAATLSTPLTLGANTTVAVGVGTLTLGGVIAGPFALTAAGSPTGTLNLNAANTYSGGTTLAAGTVVIGSSTSLGVGSSTLTFAGGTLADANGFFTVANPFVVSAPSAIGGGAFLTLTGKGVLNADLRLTNGGFLTLSGALSGPGGLTEDGSTGTTTLSGAAANTYTGTTTTITGGLTLAKTAGLTAVSSSVVLKGGGVTLGAANQLNGASVAVGIGSTLTTGGFADTVASLSGGGTLDDSTTTGAGLTVTGGGVNLLTGPVTGAGILTYNGTGSLVLGGTSSGFTGTLNAQQGSLLVLADFSGATAAAQNGGVLAGTGVVKRVPGTGTGTLSPGGGGAGGILTTAAGSGVGSALAGETLRIDIADNGPSDQLVIGQSATVDLTNATLSVNLLHSTGGAVYTIVTSPSGGISGTFAGLANGDTFVLGGRLFKINYAATAVTLTDLQAVALTPAGLPNGEAGLAYSQTITSSGGSGTVTLAVSNVTNATGLTITGGSTVTVSGTPTAAGTVTFTVTPSDANGPEAGTVYSFTVSPAVVLAPANLPAGEIGLAYSQTITSSGGSGTVTLALSGVTNATGLTIALGAGNTTVVVSGTPTAAGTVSFTVTPTDAIGTGAGRMYSFTVSPAVTLTPAGLPNGEAGLAYSQTITSSGGAAPVTLAVSNVTNTTGLTITGGSTVTVSGTPTAAGTVSFTVTPTDAAGTGTSRMYSFTVSPAVTLTPANLPAGEIGLAYSQTITSSGGSGTVTLAVSNVTNTTGLTIAPGAGNTTVVVSGTPTAAGTVSFTVTPTDAIGTGAGRMYSFTVAAPAATPALSSSSNPPQPGAPVTFTFTLTPVRAGDPTPVGTVVFRDNGTVIPGSVTSGSGTQPLTAAVTTALPAGPHTITAQFTPTGGSPYLAANAPPLAESVTSPSAATLTPQGGPTVFGDAASFLAAVPRVGGAPVPTGTVALVSAATGQVLATAALDGTGRAVLTTAALPAGTAAVRVDYSGDAYYRASSSSNVTQAVDHQDRVVIGTDAGPVATVQVRDARTGAVLAAIRPFDGYTLGVKVATGDVTGDGVADVIVSAGAGAPGGHVKVYDGVTFAQVQSFFSFPGFNGGVNVAAGDVDGDGYADVVIGAGAGPGTNGAVKVFSGKDGSVLSSFLSFPGYQGGVTVAAGDVEGSGRADVVVGSASSAGHVKVFRADGGQVASYFAYGTGYLGGIYVAAGDLDGDGRAEVVTGATNAAHVKALALDGTERASFFAYTNGSGGAAPFGARVGTADRNGDRLADILVGAGAAAPQVNVYSGLAPDGLIESFLAGTGDARSNTAGVFVGGSNR